MIKKFVGIFFLITHFSHFCWAQSKIQQDYFDLAKQMIRQFWPEMQIKLSLLPNNYIAYDSPHFRAYKGSSGCKDTPKNKDRTLAGINYDYTQSPTQTTYQLLYSGCGEAVIFQEQITYEPALKNPEDHFTNLVLGERDFIANSTKPKIIHIYLDSHRNEVLRIESHYDKNLPSTKFLALGTLIAEILANEDSHSLQIYVYSYKLKHHLPLGGKVSISSRHNTNPVIHQIDYTTNGHKKYAYIAKDFNEQSESHFNSYLSQVALSDLTNVFGGVLNYFGHLLPETETSTASLANQ
ncbi:MAG: hypothetical protein KDD40_13135, partial [Bdellovibrionales bacterium]|nr:hypothetical protein [Bdellovibrionales bacterium]